MQSEAQLQNGVLTTQRANQINALLLFWFKFYMKRFLEDWFFFPCFKPSTSKLMLKLQPDLRFANEHWFPGLALSNCPLPRQASRQDTVCQKSSSHLLVKNKLASCLAFCGLKESNRHLLGGWVIESFASGQSLFLEVCIHSSNSNLCLMDAKLKELTYHVLFCWDSLI